MYLKLEFFNSKFLTEPNYKIVDWNIIIKELKLKLKAYSSSPVLTSKWPYICWPTKNIHISI